MNFILLIFALLFFLLMAVIFAVLRILGNIFSLFGSRRPDAGQRSAPQPEPKKKRILKDEGEYVDFEEIE